MHQRASSDASDVSMRTNTEDSTSSTSTEADLFANDVAELILSTDATDVLVERAEALIDALARRSNPNEFVPDWYRNCTTQVHKILSAMLHFAPECGGPDDCRGERSQRYVASAVIACTRGSKTNDETHRALTALSLSWFSHLLWIFKGNSSYKTQMKDVMMSGEATPTLELTARDTPSGAPDNRNRQDAMRDKVLKRQGYQCAVTGVMDKGAATVFNDLPSDAAITTLRCCHIFKRSVAVFPPADSVSETDKQKHRFAMTTLDILAHYMTITHSQVISIIQNIDSPSNGIGMHSDYHDAVDDFDICFIATESPHQYTLKSYLPRRLPIRPLNPITFVNHSSEEISLPDPDLIRLHAALCGVLHLSGAGKDIETIVKDLKRDGHGAGPPANIFQSGFRFLDHMDARESTRQILGGLDRLVPVH